VFYFAGKKFADKPSIMNEFGVKELAKIKNVQPKLALFMHHLADVARKYRSDLKSAGASEELLNNIMPMADMVESGNTNQEVLKSTRIEKTKERNDKLNTVYDILKEFNKASKIIYSKDSLKRAKYYMPRKAKGGGNSGKEG
jgi:hypothetical protein